MKSIITLALLGLCGSAVLLWQAFTPRSGQAVPVSPALVEAAAACYASLDESQRARALLPFGSDERQNWHFYPKERAGLPLELMRPEQRGLVRSLLGAVLSEPGLARAEQIMQLELVLRELEQRAPDDRWRHPELYYLSFFGKPSADTPWAFRFEGHHLSLNVQAAGRQGVALTPALFGANPGEVRAGSRTGLRVLRAEEELGRALMGMLDSAQRRRAWISREAPYELITFVDRKVTLTEYQGLPASAMSLRQQEALRLLIEVYTGSFEPELARSYWQQIEAAGFGNLYFAWMGELEPRKPHYYRIHGPRLLIEYDNVQNEANHIHAVWRDPANDFGEDLLRRHYLESPHHRPD
ncbi:MAG: DUF3500 domain-containing protein [Bacteroidia bacterium]|nr:DUF3500 domain-containing protein [Bacteroidia bacterium]